MSTDLTSSTQRAIPLVARNDVQVHEAVYLGEPCWIVKDPVKLKYFRLQSEQYEVLKLLDGHKSIDQIRNCFQEKFPTHRPTRSQIQAIVVNLYEQGLAWSQRPGQGFALNYRGEKHQWQQMKQTIGNLLFIRVPGFDPTRLLERGYWMAKWIFHPAVVMWAVTIIVFSWIFIGTHAAEFSQRIQAFDFMLSWKITAMIWVTLGTTKIIHELGHAFACRHFGGECHEIGVAFLIFSPCLYCDVSDSWTLRSKWRRISIAAAGIYVELLLASFAFFVWWNTQPGDLNQICLLVFMVSNISTLLFNLNPLLRLDGYYILSDWLEVPNLRQKSEKMLENTCLRMFLGIEVETDPSQPTKHHWLFVTYALAATLYRAFLVVAICCFFFAMLKPFRLEYLGLTVGVLSGVWGIYSWGQRIYQAAVVNRAARDRNSNRPFVFSFLAVGLVGVFLFTPLPISLTAPVQVEYLNTQHLFAHTAGQLSGVYVRPGQIVRQGQILLELADEQRADRLNQLLSTKEAQAIELKKQNALMDAKQISLVAENLRSLDAEISDQLTQLNRLKVTAPCDGKIIEPRAKLVTASSKTKLASWHGTPVETLNRGCFLDTGTHLLSIAPASQFQAVLIVDQLHVHAYRIGQAVRIKLDHLPGKILTGTIDRISPATISSAHDDASQVVANGRSESRNLYQAIVRIDQDENLLLPGIEGTAKVTVATQTMAKRIWRNVRSTFNFQL